LRFASKDERGFRVVGRFCSYVLDTPPPFGSKEIEPEAILLGIGLRQEASTKRNPLGWVNHALKDRVLNPLTMIFAQSGHAAQAASSRAISGAHVVAHKHQHNPIYLQKNAG
jgi:hypothetical protein